MAALKLYKTNFETVQNQPSAEFDFVQNQTVHSNSNIVEVVRDKLKKLW